MNGTPAPHPETTAHHHFVQAPIRPLDEDGVLATVLGTAAFAVASLVIFLFRKQLLAPGDAWWLWVCPTGALLGVAGIFYCRRRSARR